MRNTLYRVLGPGLTWLLASSLTGCPASGDPPAFVPLSDASNTDISVTDASTIDASTTDGSVELDGGVCVDGALCDTGKLGICAAGEMKCDANGGGVCVQILTALSFEVCNGLDDDCDGYVDNIPGMGDECTPEYSGIGRCSKGVRSCEGGYETCTPLPPLSYEICNDEDDDCDGYVDNLADLEGVSHLAGEVCTLGSGFCDIPGSWKCNEGESFAYCTATYDLSRAVTETCNGVDDDCDGEIDEDFNIGQSCEAGYGPCQRVGVLVCNGATASKCDVEPDFSQSQAESCNGIDDNCDGVIDNVEGLGIGTECTYEAFEQYCGGKGAWVCDFDTGGKKCEPYQLVVRSPEICDGLDNDCDGQTDEDFPDLGLECFAGVGACRGVGVWACKDFSSTECNARSGVPHDEICDGLDNDCDGKTDEGTQCWAPLAPTAVGRWEVLPITDSDCAILNLDVSPNGGIEGYGSTIMNDGLEAVLSEGLIRPMLGLQIADVEDWLTLGYGADVEFLDGIRADDEENTYIQSMPRSLLENGLAVSSVFANYMNITDQGISVMASEPIEVPSPLFYSYASGTNALSHLSLEQMHIKASFGSSVIYDDARPFFTTVIIAGVVPYETLQSKVSQIREFCISNQSNPGCFMSFQNKTESAIMRNFESDYDYLGDPYVSLCMRWTMDANMATRRYDWRGANVSCNSSDLESGCYDGWSCELRGPNVWSCVFDNEGGN